MKKFTLSLIAIGVSLATFAATPLNVKTGQWEMTISTELHGAPPIPPAMLAKMTPEQRAKMEAMAGQQASRKPVTSLECVTKEDLERLFKAGEDEDEDAKCAYTVITSTGTSQDIAMNCKGEPVRTGKVHIEARNPQSIAETVDIDVHGERPSKIHTSISGRWLGPVCKEDN